MRHVVQAVRLLIIIGMMFISSNAVAITIGDVLTEDISVAFTATPSEHLLPGQPIDFVLTVTNLGDEPVTPVVLRSSFFRHEVRFISQQDCFLVISIADGEDFFVYFLSWYVAGAVGGPPLGGGESRTCHFRMALTIDAPVEYPFTFGLSSSHSDPNPNNDQVTVVLRRGDLVPTTLPARSPIGLLLLALAITVAAAMRQRCGFARRVLGICRPIGTGEEFGQQSR